MKKKKMKGGTNMIGGSSGGTGSGGIGTEPPVPAIMYNSKFSKPKCCPNINDHTYKIKLMGYYKHIECVSCQVEWFE